MKNTIWIYMVILCLLLPNGCSRETILTDEFDYLIGVSLTNVMEPWLNNMVDEITAMVDQDQQTNAIFKDGAGSAEKQKTDVEQLMDLGIDLLIIVPDAEAEMAETIASVYQEIPVIVVGIHPGTEEYTSLIQFDDYVIGNMAGEYILQEHYQTGDCIVVLEGLPNSPISRERRRGFEDALQGQVPDEQIRYMNGEWLRDIAEYRIKDQITTNRELNILFAFNDEMAYGAYIGAEKLRWENACFIGVDGFDGDTGGLALLEQGILKATIRCSGIGEQATATSLEILAGGEADKHIVLVSQLISG